MYNYYIKNSKTNEIVKSCKTIKDFRHYMHISMVAGMPASGFRTHQTSWTTWDRLENYNIESKSFEVCGEA